MTEHGTVAGYLRHNRNKTGDGEWPNRACAACRKAMSDYRRARREDPETSLIERLPGIATRLALRDLKGNHPEEYKRLYDSHRQEQARLLAEKREPS